MSRIKVAVLRGGPSLEYEVSLKTGAHVLSLLREMGDKYEPIDIFISRGGEWHHEGIAHEPQNALRGADVVWNALHGHFGEDGQVQKILENIKIPYIGSCALPSSLSYNKHLAKELYLRHSILIPTSDLVTEKDFNEDKLIAIFQSYLHPVAVKPASGVRSVGTRLAHSFKELKDAVKETFNHSKKVLVEEFIKGKEATCGIIENARGEAIYALVPIGTSTSEENEKVVEISKLAHEILGLRHYSSSDFVITPRGKIYLLQTNALPDLHEDSRMHEALKATGWRQSDFVEHCIKLALNHS